MWQTSACPQPTGPSVLPCRQERCRTAWPFWRSRRAHYCDFHIHHLMRTVTKSNYPTHIRRQKEHCVSQSERIENVFGIFATGLCGSFIIHPCTLYWFTGVTKLHPARLLGIIILLDDSKNIKIDAAKSIPKFKEKTTLKYKTYLPKLSQTLL